jgi:hypothetical protein
MNEEKKPEDTELNLEDLKKFIVEVLPVITPLLSSSMSNNTDLIKRKQTLEGLFLFMVIASGVGLIWLFIENGRPDTAEKITFALLGFLGGRGFWTGGK